MLRFWIIGILCVFAIGCTPALTCGEEARCTRVADDEKDVLSAVQRPTRERPAKPKSPARLLGLHSGDAVLYSLAPRYECAEVEGGQEFLDELARIALENDLLGIKAVSAPDMKYYLQNDQFDWGRPEFFERLDEDQGRDFFPALRELLPLGCALGPDGSMLVPWIASQPLPPKSKFGHALVIGRDVPIYNLSDTSENARKPATASWEWAELTLGSYSRFASLQHVRLSDGTRGMISPRHMRAPGDYRLQARRRNGRWLITGWINVLEPIGLDD